MGLTRRSFLGALALGSMARFPMADTALPGTAVYTSSGSPPGTTSTPSTSPPILTLSSTVAQTLAPFCVGHAFARGAIPSGTEVVTDVPDFQCAVKNRWPDGSTKFAILAGRANLVANTPLNLGLRAGTSSSGTPLTEADLLATGISATVAYSPYGCVALTPLIGVASVYSAGNARWSAGRVLQWISGSECASWLYYAPIGTDAHLSAWFEVRLWRGGAVEVLAWIENGYVRVASPGSRSGSATFSLGGQQRFQSTLTLANHCRAVLGSGAAVAHWLTAQSPVGVHHDTGYLQATRLVPAYHGNTAANSSVFTRLTTSYTPLAQADHSPAMGTPGYHPSIGLLPEWDAAYLTSLADPRAAAAVQVNALSAGRYGIHYRDESSNAPIAFSHYPHLVIDDSNGGVGSVGASSTNDYTPAASGVSPENWATSHHPSVGYLAYLVSGRRYFMEEIQFAACLGFLKQTDVVRGLSQGVLHTDVGANTTRGAAWSLRTLAQATCVTPDSEPLHSELLACVESNIRAYHARYIAQASHPQGICAPYSDYTSGDGIYMHAAWMEDFLTAAWGYIADLDFALPLDARAQLDAFFVWKCRSIIGRLGVQGVATAYNFRDAAQYNLAVAPSDSAEWNSGIGPWYANWGQIYMATLGSANSPSPDTSLRGAYYPEPTSYWGNLQPAIAYAVGRGVPGAREAYARLTGASNWNAIVLGWNDDPVWGVKPLAGSDAIFNNGFE